jgi:hypothetical protein
MNSTLEGVDTSLLEDLFNEPHCESKHTFEGNEVCSHTVVAKIVPPCGCFFLACARQVEHIQRLRANYYDKTGLSWCTRCGAVGEVDRIHVIPKG